MDCDDEDDDDVDDELWPAVVVDVLSTGVMLTPVVLRDEDAGLLGLMVTPDPKVIPAGLMFRLALLAEDTAEFTLGLAGVEGLKSQMYVCEEKYPQKRPLKKKKKKICKM